MHGPIMINTVCPECEASRMVPLSKEGCEVRCLKCGAYFLVEDKFEADCPECEESQLVTISKEGCKVRCRKCRASFVAEDKDKDKDDNDRPRKKKPATSSDRVSTQRGKSRRRHDDDEDEDQPRSRRRRRKPKESSASKVMLFAAFGLGAVLLCAIIIIPIVLLLRGDDPQNPVAQNPVEQNPIRPVPPVPVFNPQQPPFQPPFQPGNVPVINPGQFNPNPPQVVQKPIDPVERALFDIQRGNVFEQDQAAKDLVNMQVEDKRRQDVVNVLKTAIDARKRLSPRANMVDALARWSTAAEVPYFITLLDDRDGGVKQKAMKGLGQLKDARAAEPLAGRVSNFFERKYAVDALKELGPRAEPAVIKLLDDNDNGVRIEACRILKEIGTKASHPALLKIVDEANGGLAQAARDALPADVRPPVYTAAQTIKLNIHVPNLAAWPAIEKQLRSLAESKKHVKCKYNRSGDYMWVDLAPVSADPTAFATRIQFGRVGAIHTRQRLIYVNNVK